VRQGRNVGTFGLLACFSFHPRKGITTGEGGVVATNDGSLADRVRLLRSHGGVRVGHEMRFTAAGYNYRMSDILAAIGVAQLRKLQVILEMRREIALRYNLGLQGVEGLRCPLEMPGSLHTYQSYVLLLDSRIDRDTFLHRLRRQDIEATVGTYALHCQPYFADAYGYRPGDLPRSYEAYRRTVTLPLYVGLSSEDVERVVDSVRRAIREA
jgi:dTDP-4-amino-4,6-dideoxygalactose transaminase